MKVSALVQSGPRRLGREVVASVFGSLKREGGRLHYRCFTASNSMSCIHLHLHLLIPPPLSFKTTSLLLSSSPPPLLSHPRRFPHPHNALPSPPLPPHPPPPPPRPHPRLPNLPHTPHPLPAPPRPHPRPRPLRPHLPAPIPPLDKRPPRLLHPPPPRSLRPHRSHRPHRTLLLKPRPHPHHLRPSDSVHENAPVHALPTRALAGHFREYGDGGA